KHKTSYFISQLLDIAFRTTAEFYSVIVRCDKTPKPGVDYCDEHRDRRHVSIMSDDEDCIDNEDFIKLRNGKQYMRYQSLTCNTTKSFPMKYVSACHRSFVIIVYFTNCGVCLSINEIYRGETVKEILMVWFDIISATSTNIKSTLPSEVANTPLPRVILYGDCCHLIKYLIDYYDYTIHKTPASSWLINCQFAIDKLHWPNHKDIWCRKYLCPYKNPVVQANNTQSCEQANSVLKKYVNQFNRMNEERSVLMLYFLMHGRNCILKKLNVFERCVASNKMPMNTRFAANRRSVRQTQTSKCKKLPGFLLQGLTHRNNVNQNEESSSFSDVENISIHNQKRDNSNGIDSRSNDRLAKKTRMNENEIEMHDSDLLVADSSPITYCKDLSHLVNTSYTIARNRKLHEIYKSLFTFNKMTIKSSCYPLITWINHLIYHSMTTMQNVINTHLRLNNKSIVCRPTTKWIIIQNNIKTKHQLHNIDTNLTNQHLNTQSSLADSDPTLKENPFNNDEIQEQHILDPTAAANFQIDDKSHYTTYFYKQSDFKDYSNSRIEARAPILFTGKRFIL
ncbi:unnamed protein product, partial [Rotaria socialis]